MTSDDRNFWTATFLGSLAGAWIQAILRQYRKANYQPTSMRELVLAASGAAGLASDLRPPLDVEESPGDGQGGGGGQGGQGGG
jgi:hypothetical protein